MEGLEQLERRKVIHCYVCLKDILGTSNYYRHLSIHDMVAVGWISQEEGCSAAYWKSTVSDYMLHLKSEHKVTLSTCQLLPPVVVFNLPPARKGEANQGRLATPEEIEELKQNRAAEQAQAGVPWPRSESESSMDTHTSPPAGQPMKGGDGTHIDPLGTQGGLPSAPQDDG